MSGTIRSWSADSISFQPEDALAVVVLRARDVSSVEWPVTRGRQTVRGGLIGIAMGTFTGAIVAGAAAESCSGGPFCFSTGAVAALGGIAGGSVGLVVGAVIGSLSHSTRWEHGYPSPGRVTVVPQVSRQGGGLSVSLRF